MTERVSCRYMVLDVACMCCSTAARFCYLFPEGLCFLPRASSLDVVSQTPSGAWQSCREAHQEFWSVAQFGFHAQFLIEILITCFKALWGKKSSNNLSFVCFLPPQPAEVSRFPTVFPNFALLKFLPLVQTLHVVYCCYHDRQLQKTSDPSGNESKDGEIHHLLTHLTI